MTSMDVQIESGLKRTEKHRPASDDPAYLTTGHAERVINELISRHPFENSAAG